MAIKSTDKYSKTVNFDNEFKSIDNKNKVSCSYLKNCRFVSTVNFIIISSPLYIGIFNIYIYLFKDSISKNDMPTNYNFYF